MTTTALPRYEAWPLRRNDGDGPRLYPAQVRKVWYDTQGRRCMSFVIECDGDTEEEDNEMAAVCAVALAAHFGGVADTSRVLRPEWRPPAVSDLIKWRAKG